MVKNRPLKEGYLKIDNHRIYYHTYGNPKGVPYVVLHGGPGYHSTKSSLENFNLKKDFVVLYDQRGCGKSKPFCTLNKNTTPHLIEDLKKLLNLLKIEKANLVGGSWGTTLALCFAIKYPKRVASMVLRGTFLGRKKDIDSIYYPKKDWSEIQKIKHDCTLGALKKKYKMKDYVKDALKILKKKNEASIEVAKLWSLYEDFLCTKGMFIPTSYTKEDLNTSIAISLIETYYFKHNCFLPNNYILRNAKKIEHIPTIMIHGKLDQVCPLYQAEELFNALDASILEVDAKGGHSVSSGNMKKYLKSAVNTTRKQFLATLNRKKSI